MTGSAYVSPEVFDARMALTEGLTALRTSLNELLHNLLLSVVSPGGRTRTKTTNDGHHTAARQPAAKPVGGRVNGRTVAPVQAGHPTALDGDTTTVIPLVPVAILVIGLVLAGRDLGTAMILALIALGALFFSGVKLRIFILPAIAAAVAMAGFAISSPNRMRRIMSFLDPNCVADYFDSCYQPLHGVWGLAGGGIFGLGLGNSREKYDWLPAAANDYIFAIVGEELGLIGCAVILALFALFAVGAFHVIRKTDDPFVRIVSGGITVTSSRASL